MKVVHLDRTQLIPASHEDPLSPGVFKQIMLEKGDLLKGQVQMVNWAVLPVGKSFRAHYHEDMEEVFVLIRGQARIKIDREDAPLKEGDAVVVPKGRVHEMKNTCTDDVEYLVVGISEGGGGKTVVL